MQSQRPSLHHVDQGREVASKVLRRAQVSKMTRALQDRLALANIKIKHGWEHRSIDSLEPEIEREWKRKRSNSYGDMFSDTSSNVSAHCFSTGIPSSSPLTAPVFSDNIGRSGSSHGSAKRFKKAAPPSLGRPISTTTARSAARPPRPAARTWKSSHSLPLSSPIKTRQPARPRPVTTAMANFASFASETSTVVDSPSISEDDDQDLPVHSFQLTASQLSSSPPRTPPPTHARSARPHDNAHAFSPTPSTPKNGGKEGADLLLYLAASPSPAMHMNRPSEMFPPSTPPSKQTPALPSSMMGTPGQVLLGFGLNTPGPAGFNFADFVNCTPSPAQAAWCKTPTTAKTPLAAREARRRLNFDGLLSPNMGGPLSSKSSRGLGMELGEELGP